MSVVSRDVPAAPPRARGGIAPVGRRAGRGRDRSHPRDVRAVAEPAAGHLLVGRRRRHPRPRRLGDRADLARPADRTGRLRAAARPGRADGPRAASRGGVRPGPARPPAPAGRLHVVQPDARPHRPDHLGVRRAGRLAQDTRDAVDSWSSTTRACSWPPAAPSAWSWSWSPASRPPGAGSATSRGTCCTSTPTSASAWPCRTSCGPASSSSPRPARTFFWWTAWAVAAGSVLVWRIGVPVCATCATGSASPRWSARRTTSCRST